MRAVNGKHLSLIRNRWTAILAVCLSGWIAVLSFREVFSGHSHRPRWIIPLSSILPTWAVITINVGFYAYLLWLGVVFARLAEGKERILVAGWLTAIVLGPIEGFVALSLVPIIHGIKAVGMTAAFLAALLIFAKASADEKANQ